MNTGELATLREAVQRNCDIADARHGAEQSLCIYLLQMRELYRWTAGLALGAALDRAAVGNWIAQRESLWDALEAQPYALLQGPPGKAPLDPFDAQAVNEHLVPQGYLYGAGVVGRARPVFFLAKLHGISGRDGLDVQQAGVELARGLLAPPAALAGAGAGPIVVRRDALTRIGWERVEAYRLRPTADTALKAMMNSYGLDGDFEAALPDWLDDQVEMAVLHEVGEYRVSQRLGPAFNAMRAALPGPRDDAWARALRDCLADLDLTLPTLLQRAAYGAVHAWFAALDGLRLALCPELPGAYRAWRVDGDARRLQLTLDSTLERLERLSGDLLSRWTHEGPAAAASIAQHLRSAGCGVQPVSAAG